MSNTKCLAKALKTMSSQDKVGELMVLKGKLSTCKNPMIRSSLNQRIRMIEADLAKENVRVTNF